MIITGIKYSTGSSVWSAAIVLRSILSWRSAKKAGGCEEGRRSPSHETLITVVGAQLEHVVDGIRRGMALSADAGLQEAWCCGGPLRPLRTRVINSRVAGDRLNLPAVPPCHQLPADAGISSFIKIFSSPRRRAGGKQRSRTAGCNSGPAGPLPDNDGADGRRRTKTFTPSSILHSWSRLAFPAPPKCLLRNNASQRLCDIWGRLIPEAPGPSITSGILHRFMLTPVSRLILFTIRRSVSQLELALIQAGGAHHCLMAS